MAPPTRDLGTRFTDFNSKSIAIVFSKRISRIVWDARRFGLAPSKWHARLANATEPRIVCITVPKAGTHMLERALCLHPRLYRPVLPTIHSDNIERHGGLASLLDGLGPGQILVTHLHYEPDRVLLLDAKDARPVFMTRDPRDVAVSRANYLFREQGHMHHRLMASQTDRRARLHLAITGAVEAGMPSIAEVLDLFAGWLDGSAFRVRFEELVGSAGGGSDTAQRATLAGLYRYLGMDPSPDLLERIGERLFSELSPTFHRGQLGRWREIFDPATLDLFLQVVGDRLERYGYPIG